MHPIVDTHTHLYYTDELPRLDFSGDIDEVIERAKQANVAYFLLPNIDSQSFPAMMALVEKYPDCCSPMIGLHPTNVSDNWASELAFVEAKLQDSHRSFVAIGEIGLDYHWSRDYQDEMLKVFHRQLELALYYHLPVSIHSRDAEEEVIDILIPYERKGLKGVLHSFAGTAIQLERVREELPHFMVGVNGTITFKNNPYPSHLAHFPMDRIVVETDAPFLAPVPYRGKRNEPAYLLQVIAKLEELYNVSETKMRRQLLANSKKIYNLHKISL